MFHPRKFLSLVLLSLLIWLPGCGSDSNDFTATSLGGGSGAVLPLSLEENLHTLAREIGGPGISTFSRADVRGKQVEESINGAKGGSITFSGDLNFGPDSSNPASSSLTAEFNNYTFFDGLTLNGGTGTLDTVLWGTEQSAQGSLILTAENVSFSGTGSGVHNFTVEFDLVNSKVVRTVLTLDGQEQELGFIVNFSNKSQSSADQVFVTIIGKDAAQTKWHYLAGPDDEQMTEFDDQPGAFLNKVGGAFEGGEKYSLTLTDMTQVSDDTWRLIVPRENVVSGRVYVSFGKKLQGIGINAPYYNSAGEPITSGATATGVLIAGQSDVTLSGIDATEKLGLNLPVTYTVKGVQSQAVVTDVKGSGLITLSPAPTVSASTTLNFTPDPQAIAEAKLNLSGPSASGPPDYLTTFDLVELSATTDTTAEDPFYTLFANTTAIDFFSVGLGMTVEYSGRPPNSNAGPSTPSRQTVGFGETADQILAGDSPRDAILARFNNTGSPDPATPKEFQAFVTAKPNPNPGTTGPNSTGDPHITFQKSVDPDLGIIRVLGPPPIVALLPEGSMSAYLQPVIDAEWGPFCQMISDTFVIDFPTEVDPAFIYTGLAPSPNTLNLKCTLAAGSNTGLNDVYALPAPTTRIVWECDDTDNPAALPNNYQNDGTDAHRRLASIISSAFTRGVFAGGVDGWRNSDNFYTRADLRYNFFAKVMHDFALDGIVYGFAYDDVFGQDSTLAGPIGLTAGGSVPQSEDGNVVDVTLTIPNFTAPPPPAEPGVDLTIQAVRLSDDPVIPFDGCVAHLTPTSGPDVVKALDSNGRAVLTGLQANVTYTAWISPGSGWFFSYAAQGRYDGTTGGEWSSSTGTDVPGAINLKIGVDEPGEGSSLDPQPNDKPENGPPLPTPGSGQTNWGNVKL